MVVSFLDLTLILQLDILPPQLFHFLYHILVLLTGFFLYLSSHFDPHHQQNSSKHPQNDHHSNLHDF